MHWLIGSSRIAPCFGVCSFMINLPAALGLFNSHWEFLFTLTGMETSPPWWLLPTGFANTQLRLLSKPIFSINVYLGLLLALPSSPPHLFGWIWSQDSGQCLFLLVNSLWHSGWQMLQDLARAPHAAVVPSPPLNLGRASFLLPNYLYEILRAWTGAPEPLQTQHLAPQGLHHRLQSLADTQSSGWGSPIGAKNCRNPNPAQNISQIWQATGILQQGTEPKGIWGQEIQGMPEICSVWENRRNCGNEFFF